MVPCISLLIIVIVIVAITITISVILCFTVTVGTDIIILLVIASVMHATITLYLILVYCSTLCWSSLWDRDDLESRGFSFNVSGGTWIIQLLNDQNKLLHVKDFRLNSYNCSRNIKTFEKISLFIIHAYSNLFHAMTFAEMKNQYPFS